MSAQHTDHKLDAALEDSFPGSDPVSISQPKPDNRPRARVPMHDAMLQAAGDALEQGRDTLSQAGTAAAERGSALTSDIVDMTRRNPLGALAGAAAAGFFISVILRGRS